MSKKLILICAVFLLAVVIVSIPGYVSMFNEKAAEETPSEEAWKLAEAKGNAVILDFQSEQDYENRHIAGAINLSLEALEFYAAQNLDDKNQTIICYCYCGSNGGSAKEAYELLTKLGYKNAHYTSPGVEWTYEIAQEADQTEHNVISGSEAKELYDSNPGAILLDVRNQDEYNEKHIEGSMLIPLPEFGDRLSDIPDKDAVIILFCKAGSRSKIAYGILADAGYIRLYDMQSVENWPK